MNTAVETPARGASYYWPLFCCIAAAGCVADLISKRWVFQWMAWGDGHAPDRIHWLWPNYLGIQPAVNTGALFGMGQGQVTFLALISIVAIGFVLYWYARSGASGDRFLTVALGGVTGGILGNLYDRLGLWGEAGVRDWILCRYGRLNWPNFNLADSLLVVGAVLLLSRAWTVRKPESTT